jgi:hypothetical protein
MKRRAINEHIVKNNDKISAHAKLQQTMQQMTEQMIERTREMSEFKPGELTPEEEVLVKREGLNRLTYIPLKVTQKYAQTPIARQQSAPSRKAAEWAEKCRALRMEVEQRFEGCTALHPSDPIRYAVEAEFQFRHAIMQRDRAESALLLGEEATPFFAFVGLLASVIGCILLASWMYRWLGGGWRGGLWNFGLLALAGILLEARDRMPSPRFWNCIMAAAIGVSLLLILIGVLSLAVRLYG